MFITHAKMVEQMRPYRNILVCYDNHTKVGWRTEKEFKELALQGKVDWYAMNTRTGFVHFKMENPVEEKPEDYSID